MILLSLVLLIFYTLAAWSLGAMLMRLAGGPRWDLSHTPAGTTGSALLLGSAVLANLWLALSLSPLGLISPPVIAVLLVLCLASGGFWTWRQVCGLGQQFGSAVARLVKYETWPWRVVGIAALALVVLYGLTSTLPPKGDAASFYMALPKVVAHQHYLSPMPGYESFTQIGLHGEMHFAALIALGSDQAATMFVFVQAMAAVVMLIEIARRAGLGRRGRWCVLALVMTSTAFTLVIPGGKVDLFGVALGMGAIYWALHADGPQRSLALVMAGLLCGLAVVAKIALLGTLVPIVGLLALWRSAQGLEDATGKAKLALLRCATAAGILVVAAFVTVLPHMLKNQLLFAQPLAPLITDQPSWLEQEWLSGPQLDQLKRLYPVYPFLGQWPGMYGTMSAAILALLPTALLLPKRGGWWKRPLFQLTVGGVLGVALWGAFQTAVTALRYFLPALLLLVLPAAAGAEWAARKRRCLEAAVIVVLAMALAATFNRPKGHPADALKYALGLAEITEEKVGDWAARIARPVNESAQQGQRVLLGTAYTYFLRADLLASASGADDFAYLADLPPQRRWRMAYERGFAYILAGTQRSEIHDDGKRVVIINGGLVMDSADMPEELRLEPLYLESVETMAGPKVQYGAWRIVEDANQTN